MSPKEIADVAGNGGFYTAVVLLACAVTALGAVIAVLWRRADAREKDFAALIAERDKTILALQEARITEARSTTAALVTQGKLFERMERLLDERSPR